MRGFLMRGRAAIIAGVASCGSRCKAIAPGLLLMLALGGFSQSAFAQSDLGNLGGKEYIEARLGAGFGTSSSDPSYRSTGAQAPFDGDQSDTFGQVCGGVTVFPNLTFLPRPAPIERVVLGFEMTFCNGSKSTLLRIPRHGPGEVRARFARDLYIDFLARADVPVGPANAFIVSVGAGPTFRRGEFEVISDQSTFGGDMPTNRDTFWQTGIGTSLGVSTLVCKNCFFGRAAKVGIEGRGRWFGSRSVSVDSTFGFRETVRTGSTFDSSVMLFLAVPIEGQW